MKLYLISLGTGLLVGLIYGLLGVRSPAPPVVALIGLLGILLGEQVLPLAKRLATGEPINLPWLCSQCAPHVLGELPSAQSQRQQRRPARSVAVNGPGFAPAR